MSETNDALDAIVIDVGPTMPAAIGPILTTARLGRVNCEDNASLA